MDNAKVVIFEDSEPWQEILGEVVEDNGHQIAGRATTMEEAREVIANLVDGSLDVAIVDGNLSQSASGRDGAEITRLLREKLSGVTVIGFSGGDDVVGVDFSVPKAAGPKQISAIISSI